MFCVLFIKVIASYAWPLHTWNVASVTEALNTELFIKVKECKETRIASNYFSAQDCPSVPLDRLSNRGQVTSGKVWVLFVQEYTGLHHSKATALETC